MADYGFKSPYRGAGSTLPEGYLAAMMRANDGYAEGIKQATGAITEGINKYYKNKAEKETAQAGLEGTMNAYMTAANEAGMASLPQGGDTEMSNIAKDSVFINTHQKIRGIIGEPLMKKIEANKANTQELLGATHAIGTYAAFEKQFSDRKRQASLDAQQAELIKEQVAAAKTQNQFYTQTLGTRVEATAESTRSAKIQNDIANITLSSTKENVEARGRFLDALKKHPVPTNPENMTEWGGGFINKNPDLFKTPDDVFNFMGKTASFQKTMSKPQVVTLGEEKDSNGNVVKEGRKYVSSQFGVHAFPEKSEMKPGVGFRLLDQYGKPTEMFGYIDTNGQMHVFPPIPFNLMQQAYGGMNLLGGTPSLNQTTGAIPFAPPEKRPPAK